MSSPNQVEGSTEGGVALPSELWASVFGYLYLDDLLQCTAISKQFLNDVTGKMKYLCIRYGESMNVGPNVVERFCAAEDVYIFLLHEIEETPPKRHPTTG